MAGDPNLKRGRPQKFGRSAKARKPPVDVAQLVRFPGDRALIQVRAELFSDMPGVSLIPLTDGRAFLALASGKGVADLELAVVDRMEGKRVPATERAAKKEPA